MNNLYRKFRVAIINNSLEKPYWSYGDHWVDGFRDAGCEVKVFKYEEIPYLHTNFDLYFFVEIRYNPTQIPWFVYPRVVYSWDSHVTGTPLYEMLASCFDKVLLANKIDVETLNKKFPDKYEWIPEACNPRVHGNLQKERVNYLGYIGNLDARFPRNGKYKNDFLDYLKEEKGMYYAKHYYGDEYAERLNTIKVMFDRTIGHNVGTRIFEAGCAGCCPLWSKAGFNNGIEELLTEGEHYIAYDDTIEGLNKVLDNLTEEKIQEVAKAAERNALERHTYAHRVKQILNVMGFNNLLHIRED